jgi:glutamine amidotransferase
MIALIDYGSGNIRSVINALRHEQADVELVSDPARLDDAAAIVLPGVGAFGDCVRGLQSRGLWEPLATWLAADKPFFGICVGYQMLFESSEESPGVRGFGFFGGQVKRFTTPGLKVPQIGWNQLELTDRAHPLWRGLPNRPHVYFVHSFFPAPDDESIVTSRSSYGETFASSAARGNVEAVQFHPEKSQAVGLGILRNFIATVPTGAAAE